MWCHMLIGGSCIFFFLVFCLKEGQFCADLVGFPSVSSRFQLSLSEVSPSDQKSWLLITGKHH